MPIVTGSTDSHPRMFSAHYANEYGAHFRFSHEGNKAYSVSLHLNFIGSEGCPLLLLQNSLIESPVSRTYLSR